MAKIYEIDQALFLEQQKKKITTEIGIFRDRLLKCYMWLIKLADNENIKADTRLEAQQYDLEVVVSVLKLDLEGTKIIRKEQLVENLYINSKSP
jgi:hypothetical protein